MKPLNWRLYDERYNLKGSTCLNCGESFFPSRDKCICGKQLADSNMPRVGKIVAFSKVFVAPEGFEKELPYFVSLIELSNHVLILSQLVDSEEEYIKIGANVKMVFRKISDDGVINYGYKFMVVL